MSESRKNHLSLYEQEISSRLDAKLKRPDILNMFWSKRIVNRNSEILKSNDKRRFLNLFPHISDRDILAIDKGEKFGISHQSLPRVDLSKPLTSNDKDEINRYMSDKKMSATAVISADGNYQNLEIMATSQIRFSRYMLLGKSYP